MSKFCEKPKRANLPPLTVTIDGVHTGLLKRFEEEASSLPRLREELARLEEQCAQILRTLAENPEGVLEKLNLERRMEDVREEIRRIEDGHVKETYYRRHLPTLHEYYQHVASGAGATSKGASEWEGGGGEVALRPSHSALQEEEEAEEAESEDAESGDEDGGSAVGPSMAQFVVSKASVSAGAPKVATAASGPVSLDYKCRGMQKFVTRKVNPRKNEILDRYMSSVNPQYEPKMIAFGRDDKCAWCGGPMEIFAVDGFSECTKCGMSESLLFETDRRSFKDAPAENSYFAYKRINHFREWLAQFQAKESTEIPQHVFDTLHAEIKKNKIADLKTLTPQRVREFLKRHRLNKYYEHCSNILYTLNGIPPPVLSKDDEERLCNAFKELQAPFAKVCPKVAPNRKNFMSYSFVLFKLAQLLEMDHLLECFSLLKSKEKLHVQQQIWEAICKELKWEILKTPM